MRKLQQQLNSVFYQLGKDVSSIEQRLERIEQHWEEMKTQNAQPEEKATSILDFSDLNNLQGKITIIAQHFGRITANRSAHSEPGWRENKSVEITLPSEFVGKLGVIKYKDSTQLYWQQENYIEPYNPMPGKLPLQISIPEGAQSNTLYFIATAYQPDEELGEHEWIEHFELPQDTNTDDVAAPVEFDPFKDAGSFYDLMTIVGNHYSRQIGELITPPDILWDHVVFRTERGNAEFIWSEEESKYRSSNLLPMSMANIIKELENILTRAYQWWIVKFFQRLEWYFSVGC